MARAPLRAHRVAKKLTFMPKVQHARRQAIRLGFVALSDCAPLVMAQSLGLFEKHHLNVVLSREVGWATIRDKIIYGELDAAHAPAGMLVAVNAGIGAVQMDCITGLVLNLNGNAITLSQSLWRRGVTNGRTLHDYIRNERPRLVFGIVYPHSSHALLLRNWLKSHRIDPERDVQLVVVPPAQVFGNLKAGHLDGYCVGEPWNSLAVMTRTGFIAETSSDLAPGHPEKVLMLRRDFAQKHEPAHLALIAALTEAARFCDQPENRERVIEHLAESGFVNAPIQAIRLSLGGIFDFGNGRVEKTGSQIVFHANGANEPTPDKAQWVIDNLVSSGAISDPGLIDPISAHACFRPDLFQQAHTLITT